MWEGSLYSAESGRDPCGERSPLLCKFSKDSSDPHSLALLSSKHTQNIQALLEAVLHVPSSAGMISHTTSDLCM